MKIESWNLNGLLSKVKNRKFDPLIERDPDVVCLQEIRTHQQPEVMPGYHHVWNAAESDRFWGTLTLSKTEPLDIIRGVGIESLDEEGRLIGCEYDRCWILNAYVPNSQGGLAQREKRRRWDKALLELATDLAYDKPVIIAGDFNVAIHDEDIYEENKHYGEEFEGFPSDERSQLDDLIEAGFVDAFRQLHPDAEKAYTWWSFRRNRRAVNRGWRLDYFLVSDAISYKIEEVEHLTEIPGSDHCPIELVIDL